MHACKLLACQIAIRSQLTEAPCHVTSESEGPHVKLPPAKAKASFQLRMSYVLLREAL